tara:strand:- start:5231 stop:5464 length:234 start_codon:yes stop_codon:yes gene_type:complete
MADEINLGSRAQEIMNDNIWKELTAAVQDEVFAEWLETKKPDKREQLWDELKGAERFFRRMRALADNSQFLKYNQRK